MIQINKYKNENYNDLCFLINNLQDYISRIDNLDINIWLSNNLYIDKLLDEIRKNNWIIYLAFFEDKCVWCIAWIICDTKEDVELKYIKFWCVKELYVLDDYRWQKIWQLLIYEIEQYFKNNNCEYSYLDVFAPNIIAHKFYKKLWYNDRMITMNKKII